LFRENTIAIPKIYKKLFKGNADRLLLKTGSCVGRKMSEFIWYWTKGESRIYTKKSNIAEKALREGKMVMGMRLKPNIMKY